MVFSSGSGFDNNIPNKMPHSPGVNISEPERITIQKKHHEDFFARLMDFNNNTPSSSFFMIPSHWICHGRRIPFGIYVKASSGDIILRHEPNRVYRPGKIDRLPIIEDKQIILVKKDNVSELIFYLNDNLDDILSNPILSPQEKAQIFFYMAYRRVKHAYKKPDKLSILSIKQVIAILVEHIFKDSDAVKELLLLMRENVCKRPAHPMYTYVHSLNVGIMSTLLVMKALENIRRDTLEEVALGYFFHNIGMMRVPLKIVNNDRSLDRHSWSFIKQHPRWSLEMMNKVSGLSPEVEHILIEHHERPDGKGYPNSLKGSDIHFFVKACTIVDTFDALTSHRIYKPAFPVVETLKIMKNSIPGEYDASIFSRFIMLLLDCGVI